MATSAAGADRSTSSRSFSPETFDRRNIVMKLYYFETINPQKACAVARYLEFACRVRACRSRQGRAQVARLSCDQSERQGAGIGRWRHQALGIERDHVPSRPHGEIRSLAHRSHKANRSIALAELEFRTFHPPCRHALFQHSSSRNSTWRAGHAKAIEEATGFIKQFGAVLNEHLASRTVPARRHLTVADFAGRITLPYAEKVEAPARRFHEIARWHAQLNELPAWREPFPSAKARA